MTGTTYVPLASYSYLYVLENILKSQEKTPEEFKAAAATLCPHNQLQYIYLDGVQGNRTWKADNETVALAISSIQSWVNEKCNKKLLYNNLLSQMIALKLPLLWFLNIFIQILDIL